MIAAFVNGQTFIQTTASKVLMFLYEVSRDQRSAAKAV